MTDTSPGHRDFSTPLGSYAPSVRALCHSPKCHHTAQDYLDRWESGCTLSPVDLRVGKVVRSAEPHGWWARPSLLSLGKLGPFLGTLAKRTSHSVSRPFQSVLSPDGSRTFSPVVRETSRARAGGAPKRTNNSEVTRLQVQAVSLRTCLLKNEHEVQRSQRLALLAAFPRETN